MSMLNSQGSLICLQRGYGFSFTPKQPFRSKTWCDPFEFILFRAHDCDVDISPLLRKTLELLTWWFSWTADGHIHDFEINVVQLQESSGIIWYSRYHSFTWSRCKILRIILRMESQDLSQFWLRSRKSDKQSKTVRCALVTLPQAKKNVDGMLNCTWIQNTGSGKGRTCILMGAWEL
jgi:hypothetical protein